MALLSKRGRPHGSIPMSSMADIAFLLLIFFLVTTIFPKDKGLAIVLPQGESLVSASNVVHFLVGATGLVEIRFGESPLGRTIKHSEVEAVWRSAVANNPRLIAAVKTDPDAAYVYMIDVLDALLAAGAQRVSLQELAN